MSPKRAQRLHESVVKKQDPDLVHSHLLHCVCVIELRTSKADLDSDHVLVIFGEHPDSSLYDIIMHRLLSIYNMLCLCSVDYSLCWSRGLNV